MDVRKIDVIVDKIMILTDEDGYFSPNELRSAFSRQRDLQKVAGLTINQLEKHFFSKGGLLRVPTHLGKESVKKFINVAKTAHLHGKKLSFAEAEEIVEKQRPLMSVQTSDVKNAAPAPVQMRPAREVRLRKAVVPPPEKKEVAPASEPEETTVQAAPEPTEPGQKIDELVRIIGELADLDGYFDPKDAYARVRGTGLSKRLSVIVSNLRLQGFVRDAKLRVPASGGPEAIKGFINLAARLRRQQVSMSFENALASLPAETAPAKPAPTPELEPAPAPEPIAEVSPAAPAPTPEPAPAPPAPPVANVASRPAEALPELIAEPQAPVAVAKPEENYKALYEEMKAKVYRLDGELSAYKDMCFHFIELFKR